MIDYQTGHTLIVANIAGKEGWHNSTAETVLRESKPIALASNAWIFKKENFSAIHFLEHSLAQSGIHFVSTPLDERAVALLPQEAGLSYLRHLKQETKTPTK